MNTRKTVTFALIPLLAIAMAACGKKKKAPKPADKPVAAPVSKDVTIDDATKNTLTAAYGTYDEKNGCFIAKTRDGDYCMATNRVSETFTNGGKTKLTLAILESKGKMANGVPDASAEGGVGIFLINPENNTIVTKLPYAKTWDKGSVEHQLKPMLLGNEIEGLYAYDIAKKDGTEEIQKLKVFGSDGKTFHPLMDIRVVYANQANQPDVTQLNTKVTPDEVNAAGYRPFTLTVTGKLKGNPLEEKTFRITYNKAKHQYDVPIEYRKLMGE